jgi:glycosyltransferase involved in cell wall biosynthesis
MRNNRVKTVALIPAYNEESSIAKVILRAKRYVDEVIVCDDGSTDMTFMIAKELGARVVRHGERQGKGEALRTLSKEVMEMGPDIIVTLDGDGQHDPDEIPMLLKPIETGESDVVVGSRYVDGGKMNAPLYRKFGLRVINFLYRKFGGVRVKDTQSGFRAYSKKAFKCLIQYDAKGYGIEGEQSVLAAKNGLKVMEVPISVNYKGSRRNSKKSPLLHGADLISTLFRLVAEGRPLMYLGLPGIGFICLGMVLGLYLLWMFNITRYFSIPVAVLTVGFSIAGLLLVTAAIILHGLNRIKEKIDKFHAVNNRDI